MARLDHINVIARDGAAMVDFFVKTLGAREGFRPAFSIPGHWLYLDGIPAIHVNVIDAEPPRAPGLIDHFAFGVFEEPELAARLASSGYRYERGDGIPGGVGQFFVYGPEAIKIELQYYR